MKYRAFPSYTCSDEIDSGRGGGVKGKVFSRAAKKSYQFGPRPVAHFQRCYRMKLWYS